MTSRTRHSARRTVALFLALLVALQTGCATHGPVTLASGQPLALGRVALVASVAAPEIRFEGMARGAGEGATTGAGTTFLQCTSALGHGSCGGAACGAVVVLWMGVCGVASLVGGVAGAAAAPDAGSVLEAEKKVAASLELKMIQESLRDQVAAAALAQGTRLVRIEPERERDAVRAGDYRPLAANGADMALETTLTRVGTAGTGINAPITGYMEARVRLVRTSDNSELFTTTYLYHGARTTFAEWSANQGAQLLNMLNAGYEALGTHIYESVFLLYPFPDRDPHGAGLLATSFGLAPVYPSTRFQLSGDRLLGRAFEWTTVDSLQPTLQWQGFPRASDMAAAPDDMKRVTRVRYDLVIAREHNNVPAEIVYRRSGLPEPTHRPETSLAGNTRYFWTVRARFELDGRERVTEWGSTHYIAREKITGPSQYSYRFRTPG